MGQRAYGPSCPGQAHHMLDSCGAIRRLMDIGIVYAAARECMAEQVDTTEAIQTQPTTIT